MIKAENVISRQIEIDMGHRVPTHGSKCYAIHGHRYKIIAVCEAHELQSSGEQTDMVLDFGFLKDVMMTRVYDYCDHGMVLWDKDPWLEKFLSATYIDFAKETTANEAVYFLPLDIAKGQTKLLVVPFIPTAERLARYWFKCMEQPVKQRSNNMATLVGVEVYETPNCKAEYRV